MDWNLLIVLLIFACFIFLMISVALFPHKKGELEISSKPNLLSKIVSGEIFYNETTFTAQGLLVTRLVSSITHSTNGEAYSIYIVDLPFISSSHILGIPTSHSKEQLIVDRSELEEVVLEGDYPHYFHLYTAYSQQVETRYVLDPKAMIFTVDFCNSYFWEIDENTLYFMINKGSLNLALVDQFVKEIQPAIVSPNNSKKLLPSYSVLDHRDFKCPVCSAQLHKTTEWLECPEKHGFLLTGRQLISLRSMGEILTSYKSSHISQTKEPNRPHHLRCPHCLTEMTETNYQLSKIKIDVCKKCGYRWLDSHELTQILS